MTGVFIDSLISFSEPIWGPPYTGNNAHFLAAMVAFGSIMLLSNVRKTVYQFMQKRELELGVREFSGVGRSAQGAFESFDRSRSEAAYSNQLEGGEAAGGLRGRAARFVTRVLPPRGR